MAKSVADVMSMVKENEVKFVDFRFTDTRGKEQHVTVPVSHFDEEKFTDGHAFDGSSIAGWKGIEASDMLLIPDASSAFIDPFFEEITLVLICDVIEPTDGKAYERDPRSIAKRAEAYLKQAGLGDTAYFGPEPEFFLFDSVRWSTAPGHTFYAIDEYEAPWNSGTAMENGANKGHRPRTKGGYFPVPPVDSTMDLRNEISQVLEALGIPHRTVEHPPVFTVEEAKALRGNLPGATVAPTDTLGVAGDWVEAMAFAWLARQRLHALPGNCPRVTGASRPAVLGGLWLPE